MLTSLGSIAQSHLDVILSDAWLEGSEIVVAFICFANISFESRRAGFGRSQRLDTM